MANFQTAFKTVLSNEGGYQNNINDAGNYNSAGVLVGTNYGITSNLLQSIYDFVPTANFMQTMAQVVAEETYKIAIWNAYNLGAIQNQQVANIIFDTYVLFSYSTAQKLIEQAIVKVVPAFGRKHPLEDIKDIDLMGKSNELINQLVIERINYHLLRVEKDATQQIFLKGWINRANRFKISIENTVKGYLPYLLIGGVLWWLYKSNRKK